MSQQDLGYKFLKRLPQQWNAFLITSCEWVHESTWLTTCDANFDHLVKMVFTRFLCVVILFPFHTSLFEMSHWVQPRIKREGIKFYLLGEWEFMFIILNSSLRKICLREERCRQEGVVFYLCIWRILAKWRLIFGKMKVGVTLGRNMLI